mgnify:CR=1 FL=1
MLLSLKKAGKYKLTISLGRTEPMAELLNGLNLSFNDNRRLKKIISSKLKVQFSRTKPKRQELEHICPLICLLQLAAQ